MTDEKKNYRISPLQLCMSDAMPFQQHHECRIAGRDIDEVIGDELFLNVKANLQVGDEIVICGYEDQTWQRLQQIARTRVTSISQEAVKLLQEGKTVEIPMEKRAEATTKPQPIVEVKRGFGGVFNVLDLKKDSVIESFKTKQEAVDYAKSADPAYVGEA